MYRMGRKTGMILKSVTCACYNDVDGHFLYQTDHFLIWRKISVLHVASLNALCTSSVKTIYRPTTRK